MALILLCLAVLSLLLFSTASTSSVSKPFLCPLLTDPPPSKVLRLNLHHQKLDHRHQDHCLRWIFHIGPPIKTWDISPCRFSSDLHKAPGIIIIWSSTRCHALVKDSVAFPRASRAFSAAPITSPPLSSELTCSNLCRRKRIGLIRPPTRRQAPTEVSARIEPRAARTAG